MAAGQTFNEAEFIAACQLQGENGGASINIEATGHNLPNGITVEIMGTTSYNGSYTITVVDANNFTNSI